MELARGLRPSSSHHLGRLLPCPVRFVSRCGNARAQNEQGLKRFRAEPPWGGWKSHFPALFLCCLVFTLQEEWSKAGCESPLPDAAGS